ncbi:leucyl/phenylalanyl-tRNA--protein transferase [Thalassotalea insulae]|uniref:Leucyl/phenylalanyl-tRNA--protein transferase n=1 Tax=Thalassotalea insulae TaxID=2056778 RepID=A0ABQ6H1L8_9GAMM|nr:leucyl/phenylalanyl-tRNA--protein transferase [Thalassotalea insulae]GLX80316.1 leucyl/phenylalanyl-tRNA--protein transferase [Thalassotalea insulae]
MAETLHWLEPESLAFPPPDSALSDPNGLLAIGGDLSAKRLVAAYSQGIFPWFNEDEPILWWSPSSRAVIPVEQLYINRSLKKLLNKKLFSVTINQAFEQVIDYCADAPFRREGTWINSTMLAAYKHLHQLGYAHSIEVWHQQNLVGGLYGVAINGFFSGESMFYLKDNASKFALVGLVNVLKQQGVKIIDCQITNPFLTSMGCIEVSRATFDQYRQQAMLMQLPAATWQPRTIF